LAAGLSAWAKVRVEHAEIKSVASTSFFIELVSPVKFWGWDSAESVYAGQAKVQTELGLETVIVVGNAG
jgi:hypothetical protein